MAANLAAIRVRSRVLLLFFLVLSRQLTDVPAREAATKAAERARRRGPWIATVTTDAASLAKRASVLTTRFFGPSVVGTTWSVARSLAALRRQRMAQALDAEPGKASYGQGRPCDRRPEGEQRTQRKTASDMDGGDRSSGERITLRIGFHSGSLSNPLFGVHYHCGVTLSSA